jgi:hypothetical protein
MGRMQCFSVLKRVVGVATTRLYRVNLTDAKFNIVLLLLQSDVDMWSAGPVSMYQGIYIFVKGTILQ